MLGEFVCARDGEALTWAASRLLRHLEKGDWRPAWMPAERRALVSTERHGMFISEDAEAEEAEMVNTLVSVLADGADAAQADWWRPRITMLALQMIKLLVSKVRHRATAATTREICRIDALPCSLPLHRCRLARTRCAMPAASRGSSR